MAPKFETDTFHVERTQLEFLEAELNARIKEYDFCIMIGGRKVEATVEFNDGVVLIDVETPVKYIRTTKTKTGLKVLFSFGKKNIPNRRSCTQ